jgi:aminoglycoside 6'-N-acetyltransferase I
MKHFETISEQNIESLIPLVLALWPECIHKEEVENYQRILTLDRETVYLAKVEKQYVGFIHLSLRTEHVEGTHTSPVVYVEGLYIQPPYREKSIAKVLVQAGEAWGLKHHCREMASDTESSNVDSIAFHQKVGFEVANRIVCFRKDLE